MPSKPLKAIKPMFAKDKWRVLRGDLVQIMAGKDKGLTGRVLRVIRDTRFPRVIVEGRNMVRVARGRGRAGGRRPRAGTERQVCLAALAAQRVLRASAQRGRAPRPAGGLRSGLAAPAGREWGVAGRLLRPQPPPVVSLLSPASNACPDPTCR